MQGADCASQRPSRWRASLLFSLIRWTRHLARPASATRPPFRVRRSGIRDRAVFSQFSNNARHYVCIPLPCRLAILSWSPFFRAIGVRPVRRSIDGKGRLAFAESSVMRRRSVHNRTFAALFNFGHVDSGHQRCRVGAQRACALASLRVQAIKRSASGASVRSLSVINPFAATVAKAAAGFHVGGRPRFRSS
jgi:hypothetical protein